MTQMLGLCSGKFDDSNSIPLTMSSSKGSDNRQHQSSLDFQDENANNSFSHFTFRQSNEGATQTQEKGTYVQISVGFC